MNVTALFSVISAVLYIGAGITLLLRSRGAWDDAPWLRTAIRCVVLAAAIIQAWALYRLMFNGTALNFSFLNSASLIGLEIAVIALVGSLRLPIIDLGAIIYPIVGISVIGAWLSPSLVPIPDEGWALDAHIIVSLFAYSLISIAAVQALLLALQDYRLHHRKTNRLTRFMPPLQAMEQFMFQTIVVGFVLLSVSLFTGFWYMQNMFAQNMVEKTSLSIVAWCVFALLLWGRWRFGWRGRTATGWTLGGFVALVLAYFGSKLLLAFVLIQPHIAA